MSEASDRNRNILLAIAGAGLVLGAAVLYHWASSADEDTGTAETPDIPSDLLDRLKAEGLDKPKKQGQMIDKQYFLMLLNFVGAQTNSILEKPKKQFDVERRVAFKNGNDAKYSEIADKMMEQKETISEQLVH